MSSKFDEATQRELQVFVEQETAKAQMQNTIHEFTNRCWESCIFSAKSNQLDAKETQCLQNCVGRFIDTSVFIVKRLQTNNNF
ncbi:Mitochondrial import inner membrane translocase subunit tim8 [Coemansia sp. RSA 2703]|nr:Mitochondrial import inner membrane translocase subunit tim8 [Coemansia sp. RSA 2703]KAJ1830693.1 Mitochondrial import inner membrane translocase subunit tim8 [Coemansia sp. RSA 2703]KAJ2373010.1 Mitochondrial import inner membrane translocase subunit tim8 [Coemansia sp. RSA 2607]KAJ2377930.1 Mitochondrial import inner membrane translocase subunit tim8 [Coemansia sp. RSA 2603]